jgi:MYXO-CTERM domain-containing protein
MARQEGGQCSIAAMRHPLAWALGGFALFGFLRRRREAAVSSVDPRAEELRLKLAESRAIVEERDEFEGAELTVDLAEPAPEDPDSRRRAVHDAARDTVRQMRKR